MAIVRDRPTTEEIVRLNREFMAPFNGRSPEMAALNARLRLDGLFTMNHWNAIFTNPPLCISEAQLREGIAIIDRALEVTDAAVVRAGERPVPRTD